ncbi:hypothetical protein [Flagellimonas sp. S3867]|uniref:hypothetical protein n=1 Tax=Flagellimonas sp. S3867 TaxID=2768063 RepID=UPI0016878D28|nr:hypothetical protein [Flagellimonas sp. S3867]
MRLFFFITIIFLVVSCDNEEDIPVTVVEIKTKSNQELYHYLGNLPVEGGYSITRQARSHLMSEILYDGVRGGLFFVYIPKKDFKGLDIVEITWRISPGNQDYSKSLTVLRITVE